jgi:AcrR family transcriptional regulator
MPVVDATWTTSPRRRVPRQERSRRRVEGLLDAAARVVVEHGVDAVSTRDIAEAADAPVASLYQYFNDKEDVLLALAQRDMDEMDAQVAEDLAQLKVLSVETLVRTTMLAFVSVYHRRPAFVEIYLRGRTNQAVHQFGREHNARVAENLRAFAIDAGLADDRLTPKIALLAVEVGDRIFQLAFAEKVRGDTELIEEGIVLVTSYLDRYATAKGRTAKPRGSEATDRKGIRQ